MIKNNGYLDIDNQIELIKSKKIEIDVDLKNILKQINYYNLMNYKNLFYTDGIEHKYKSNLKISYFIKLYYFDIKIKERLNENFIILKNIYINEISNFFGYYEKGFNENAFLDENLYNNNIIKDYYYKLKSDNLNIKKYYYNHGFIPIWVVLNSLDYSQLITYYLSFKENYIMKMDNNIKLKSNVDMLKYSCLLYNSLKSNDKILDFKYKKINMEKVLKWLSLYNIDNSKIKKIYFDIIKEIICIKSNDIKRITGIIIKGDDKNVK